MSVQVSKIQEKETKLDSKHIAQSKKHEMLTWFPEM